MPKSKGDEQQGSENTKLSAGKTIWQKQLPRVTAWPTGIDVPTGLYQVRGAKYIPKPITTNDQPSDIQSAFMAAHALPEYAYNNPVKLEEELKISEHAAEYFLNLGGDINKTDKGGECRGTVGLNVMTISAKCGQEKLFRKYMYHENVDLRLSPFAMDGIKTFAIHRFALNPLQTQDGCVKIIWEILNVTAWLIDPNADDEQKQVIFNKLLEIPKPVSGYTVLIEACASGNIALLRWLTYNFKCDFSILGSLKGHSALAAACASLLSKDTKLSCLEHLILECGQNIAEIPHDNPNDPYTPIYRSGVMKTPNSFREFLVKAYNTKPELFNEIVKQIANSSNQHLQQKIATFGGLNKIFGILNRELDAPMQAALQNARTPVQLKNT